MRFSFLPYLFVALLLSDILSAQPSTYHFNKLTVNNGLNDGDIHAIGQDKYGFMWFSSQGGLNRFNGYSIKLYNHIPGDSTTPLGSMAQCMALDSTGRLWIGFETGLMEYVYSTGSFRYIPAAGKTRINKLYVTDNNLIYLGTDRGLGRLDPATGNFIYFSRDHKDIQQQELFKTRVYSICQYQQQLYLGAGKGLFLFDIKSEKGSKITVPELEGTSIRAVVVDGYGNTWLGTHGEIQLLKLTKNKTIDYTGYFSTNREITSNNVNDILLDRQDKVWIITSVDGLLEYVPSSDSFQKHVYTWAVPGSPANNLHRVVYEDRNGTIWLGGNQGLNYFNPTKSLFHTILPFASGLDTRNRKVARGVAEDLSGNLWFATLDGVSRYSPNTHQYQEWNNKLNKKPLIYYNSTRAVLTDEKNRTWIATGAGINRYDPIRKVIQFISQKDLPRAFYFSLQADRQGRLWFGTRDYDGFYWFDTKKEIYGSIKDLAGLKEFAGRGGRYFFEDSKGRYWLGFNGNGLGMFDPSTNKNRTWTTDAKDSNTIIGNLVIDIKEDRSGIIWVSTTNGITSIDLENNRFNSYNSRNGLLSNTASALGIDAHNRLWIATTRGINMLDSTRKIFTSFGVQDGLPSAEFQEHPGYTARNGDFIFPSSNGYVRFDPMNFGASNSTLPFYLSGVKVFNENYPVKGELGEVSELRLKPNQNSFSFEFVALNYDNPGQTWYAYKLEGFDKDWVITQKHEANYTNVPGGNYNFLFRATNHPAYWDQEPKAIRVKVATVFYKTSWFLFLVVLLLVGLLYFIYQFRLRQQKQLMELKGKSQMLEKEKALVMYESLKQQLNPHFLFNSLTSLRSLIRTRPEQAGDFLDGLSRTYRYILKSRDSETVSIGDEIKFAETYVQLQRTRFPRGFNVGMQIPGNYHHRKIVPVTIQNLVENAIKHNLIDAEMPLTVTISVEGDYLVVKNNLQRKEFVETSNKQGLENLRSLYQYLHENPVIIKEDEFSFTVKIPLL